MTGVKIFVIGKKFYQPLIDFIENTLSAEGMIDEEDIELIRLTDDLEHVALEIEASLLNQIKYLKEVGLDNTTYYKSLLEFFEARLLK